MSSNLEKIQNSFSKLWSQHKSKLPKIKKKHVLVLSLLSLPALFYTEYFLAFGLMVLTSGLSIIVNSYDANSLGIELATFSTVIIGQVFPSYIAAGFAFAYIMLQLFSGSNPGIYMMWVVPSYTIMGFFIGNFTYLDPIQLGLYAALTLQSFFVVMTFLNSRSRLPKFIQYSIFNLTFNFFLFTAFAKPMLSLVGA